MATTLASFYANYKDLALSGVTSLDESPLGLPSVKLPCKFIDSVGMDEAPLRAKGTGGNRTFRCRIVVLVAAVGQNLHGNRWTESLAMVDTLNAGIKTVANRGKEWSINIDPNFAEAYFAVLATIEEPESGV